MNNQLFFIVLIVFVMLGMLPYLIAKKGSAMRSNLLIVSVVNILCMVVSMYMQWDGLQNVVLLVWVVSMVLSFKGKKNIFVVSE